MKKLLNLILVAILGGVISVGVYKIIEKKFSRFGINFGEEKPIPNSIIKQIQNNPTSSASYPEGFIDFTYAAEKSVHAVVHIQTKTEYFTYYYDYYDFFNPFRDFFDYLPPKQRKNFMLAAGSGVIISDDGYIVTNNHVIDKADQILITLNDKREYPAKVIGSDRATDLALLKIDEKSLPFIPFGNSDNLKVGEWVLAVGNPFNLTSTVTAGIVSAKGRNINIIADTFALESFIQTDAAVNRGNSGGALVNIKGELIGINCAIASTTGTYAGYSFAIPVNIVKKVIDDLLAYGQVQRAFLGIQIQNMDSKLAEQLGIKETDGVYISNVMEGGSAAEAGIVKGDIITKIGEISVNNVAELQEQIGRYRPGDEINITIKRDGKEKVIRVVLKNKRGDTGIVKETRPEITTLLGAVFEPISKDDIKKMKIDHGIKITQLYGGKLRQAGIREGFIITFIDKKPISTVDDLVNILSNKKGGVLIEGIYPNGVRAYYALGL